MKNEVLATVVRIPESDIVVTRKVPMTDQTCDELRAIRIKREEDMGSLINEDVIIPFPTLIQQLIHEEFERIQ